MLKNTNIRNWTWFISYTCLFLFQFNFTWIFFKFKINEILLREVLLLLVFPLFCGSIVAYLCIIMYTVFIHTTFIRPVIYIDMFSFDTPGCLIIVFDSAAGLESSYSCPREKFAWYENLIWEKKDDTFGLRWILIVRLLPRLNVCY